MQVPGRGALRPLRHGGMREAPAVIRSDVGARKRREGERQRQGEMGRAHHQLFGAPAAAHAAMSLEALAFEPVPEGGMSPPSQLRRERFGSAIGALLVRISPLLVSQTYDFAGVLIWL